jgi:hypothetical protein
METTTNINKLNVSSLWSMLNEICNGMGLRLEDSYNGDEIHQADSNPKRLFVWETVNSFGLDFTNTDASGEHSIRVLDSSNYDDYNTNTYKKNLRNAIRLLTSDKELFAEDCTGCENCEWR